MDELLQLWREIDERPVLRFSPRLFPPSIFSSRAVWQNAAHASDEKRAKKDARCDMWITCVGRDDGRVRYFKFTPGGKRGWEAPLDAVLVASCSIPLVFPPVRINGRLYVDGGVPASEPLSFQTLSGCADVIVLEMVRAEEVGRKFLWPGLVYEQKGRDLVRAQMNAGVSSLGALPKPPRIFRIVPSRVLDFGMLSFKSCHCDPAMEQGFSDGRRFLADPSRFIASARPTEPRMGPAGTLVRPG